VSLVARTDRGEVSLIVDRADRGELARPVKSAGGTVVYEAYAARVGMLQYPWGVEHRDGAELQRIVDQLNRGAQLTIRHPAAMISEGSDYVAGGRVISARVDDGYAMISFRANPAGVAAISAGVRELSLGYHCRIDDRDFQRDTRVDHVALVERGRCGHTCSVRVDDCGVGRCVCAISGKNKHVLGSDLAMKVAAAINARRFNNTR
jgi:hypothetical protein